MELAMLRGIGTLVLFLSFVAYCVWAWSPAQRRRFDEASMLPFCDGDEPAARADGRIRAARTKR